MKRAILLVDHGSRQPLANRTLVELASLVRTEAGEGWLVEAAHLELEPPSIAEAFAECVQQGAQEVIIHPCFITPGRHATIDIPALVSEAALLHPGVAFRVTEPLGVHSLLAQLVLVRCGVK